MVDQISSWGDQPDKNENLFHNDKHNGNGSVNDRHRLKDHSFVNPFIYNCVIPWYQWLKIYVLTITLAPIRLVMVGVSLFLTALVATIALRNHDTSKPLTGWRKKIALPIFLVFARLVFFSAGFQWISVKGTKSTVAEAPILVVAPHSSFLDALIVVFLGMPSVVGKTETARNPYVGCLLRMTQPILVSREESASRQTAMQQIQTRCMDENWPQVMIFPEGTCTNRTCLINFKLGAFAPGVPVQPIILKWNNRVDGVTWTWEGPGIWHLVWLCVAQFHHHVYLEYLPVYHPSKEEKVNPTLFANNVRTLMAEALNLPTTDYAYQDCHMMTLAKRHGLMMANSIVEFAKLSRDLQATHGSLSSLYVDLESRYQRLGNTGSHVTFDQFAQYLQQPETPMLHKIFEFYTKDDVETIDLREFILGLTLITSPEDPEETLKLAFRLYSTDNNHTLSHEDLSNLLRNAFSLSDTVVDSLMHKVSSKESHNVSIDMGAFVELCRSEDVFSVYRDFKRDFFSATKLCHKRNAKND